ncbi:MAG TPA: hypothetical protein GX728_06625 [Clostridiaceae bacterium]|jgi:hypothetical protein|nr:hypothetical protein [Clostridiaceae bacterium]
MRKDVTHGIYWFFSLAPFLTAIPLFFLMPEKVPARILAFTVIERLGTRWEVFLIPLSWLVVAVVVDIVLRVIERSSGSMLSMRMVVTRILLALIFCTLAIYMELILYRTAMIYI